MKLTIAGGLDRLRILKSRISQVEGFVKAAALYDEDQAPETPYVKELAEYLRLDDEILALKARIQETNAVTRVEHAGRSVTLAELILVNARIRSQLAFYRALLDTAKDGRRGGLYESRTKDMIRKVTAEGFSTAEVRGRIQALEDEKSVIESVLSHHNQRTELAEG